MANVEQTTQIQRVLRNQLLPVKGTNLAYIVGKNLSKIDKFLDDINKQVEELKKSFTVKDPEGKEVLFEIDEHRRAFKTIAGNFVIAPEGHAHAAPRVDATPEYLEALEQIGKEEFNDFHTIPSARIEELANQGLLDGVDLAILMGNVIAE